MRPKWRRRAEARPEEIIDAALAVFVEKGFEASRMEDVAREAGLSKAGVYLYFSSKQALLEALIDSKIRPIALEAHALTEANEGDPKAALRSVARALVARLGDEQFAAAPRLVLGLATRFPEIGVRYRERVIEVSWEAFERLFKAGVRNGQFHDVPSRAAARAFIGPLIFETLWAHVFGGESAFADSEKLLEEHLEVLFNGIEAQMEKRS